VVYLELFGQSAGSNYDQLFSEQLDHIRQIQADSSPLVRTGLSPHAIYTSNRGLLKLCAEACAELDLPIALHLAETWAEVDYSLDGTGPLAEWRERLGYEPMVNGVRPAEYLDEIGLLRDGVCLGHCVYLSESEVQLVAASGASVAHCPRSNAYLGAGIAPVTDLLASGARVGIGTDSAGSCMRFDFFEEMRFALGLQRARAEDATVLTAKRVLELASLGGARALGLSDRIGSLEPGKRADMIAVDLGGMLPGEDIWLHLISRSPRDVRLVVVDGVEVASDGRLANVDAGACAAELRARMESLVDG
jgi:5-methylthioadenosine/S-adenosylhomocysteine deaminase